MAGLMWTKLQTLPWFLRWLTKWALLGVTVFLVSFPNPATFVRHWRHTRNPEAMIDPDNADLQPWVDELKERLDPELEPAKALKVVQRFVYQKVPYKYDWETWGCADYLPTVAEVLEMGHEDCDGQAVVAASLLRNLGYKAVLVSDFAHVWVKTDKGETMSPGKKKSAVATKDGYRVDWSMLLDTGPAAAGLGVAIFPLGRELIVLAVGWVLLLRGRGRWPVRLLCLLLMVDGLLILRGGGMNWPNRDLLMQWVGLLHVVAAVVVLLVVGRRTAPPSSAPEQSPSVGPADPAL